MTRSRDVKVDKMVRGLDVFVLPAYLPAVPSRVVPCIGLLF